MDHAEVVDPIHWTVFQNVNRWTFGTDLLRGEMNFGTEKNLILQYKNVQLCILSFLT